LRIDAEGDAVKAYAPSRSLRLSLEQRQFRASAIARNHQRPARISRPLSIIGKDFQAQHTSVPLSGFEPVRDKHLNVIDLEDSGAIHSRTTIVDKGLMPSVHGKLTDQQLADIVTI
jgi:hypothetical protein